MDRLAAHVVATAVLTVALAAVPTAMASPRFPPAPHSAQKAARQAAATAPAGPSGPDRAVTPGLVPIPCSDARQVGATAYVRWHGMVAFSVKQFYSPICASLYGYAYPWLQFRNANREYDLGVGVFDTSRDAIDGPRSYQDGRSGPDFWSAPVVATAGTCTQALVHVFFPDAETDTFSDKVCQATKPRQGSDRLTADG
jgi:hypothetical protein